MGVVWAGTGEARGGYLTPCIPCSLSKPRWIWASLVGARAVTGPEPGGATGRACLKRVGVCVGGKRRPSPLRARLRIPGVKLNPQARLKC